jgi:hypothetical protein
VNYDSITQLKDSLDRKSMNTLIEDFSESLRGLQAKHPGGEHPVLDQARWRYAVQACETLEGYWPWVHATLKDVSRSMTTEDFSKAFSL